MGYAVRSRDEHLRNDGRPKRILALDGGGLRGILSLGVLGRLESLLAERHGAGAGFRLSHYFDLIAGTSTGAIIAAAIAKGWTVEEVRARYMELGRSVFERSLLRRGFLRAKYDEGRLIAELKRVYGATTRLGSPEIETGLVVVTKRLDTGSPWPISNNPGGRFFRSDPESIGNGDYLLWEVVRASTAAPSYFDPEPITIARASGKRPVEGEFVDGGMSPFNNPALLALMYATLEGYRIGWPMGAERLLLVSIGTGAADPAVPRTRLAAAHSINALLSLMEDCAALQETVLQWLSTSPTARAIDVEVGDLQRDLLGSSAALTYLRYNLELGAEQIRGLEPGVDTARIAELSAMDAPENMDLLHRLGARLAARDIDPADFPGCFDLSGDGSRDVGRSGDG